MFFVSPTGRQDKDGLSVAAPIDFVTANFRAKPGDIVTVLPGSYTDPVRTTTSGIEGKKITWISSGLHAAKISVVPANVVVWLNSASFVDIIGFDISGGRVGLCNAGEHVTISRNHIHNVGYRCTSAGGAGILLSMPAVVQDNAIADIGIFDPVCETYHGISACPGAVLRSNTITRCSGSLLCP